MLKDWVLGSRKFIFISLLLLTAGLFRIFNLLTSADFASLLSSVGVAFMGANTVEHMFSTAKEWIAAKAEKSNAESE